MNKVTPVSLGYPLSVFNKNSTLKEIVGNLPRESDVVLQDMNQRHLALRRRCGIEGSQNRDRGGMQCSGNQLRHLRRSSKLHPVVGFSGISNAYEISSGGGGTHCENPQKMSFSAMDNFEKKITKSAVDIIRVQMIERTLLPGGVFYVLCSLIKDPGPEEEDPPRIICTRCFEGDPLPPGS